MSSRAKAGTVVLVALLVAAVVASVLLWRRADDLEQRQQVATAESEATKAAAPTNGISPRRMSKSPRIGHSCRQ